MRLILNLLIAALVAVVSTAALAAEPAPSWVPPPSQLSPGSDVAPSSDWLLQAPMLYWMVYEHWPEHWRDVFDAGFVTQPLYDSHGRVIDPDDGRFDFTGDMQYSYRGTEVPLLLEDPSTAELYRMQRQQWPIEEHGELRWLLTAEKTQGVRLSGVKLYFFAPLAKANDFYVDADSAEWKDGKWVFYNARQFKTFGASANSDMQMTAQAAELTLGDFDVNPDKLPLTPSSPHGLRGSMLTASSTITLDGMLAMSAADGRGYPELAGNKERQRQLAICSLIKEGVTRFYEAYGRPPASYAELAESGFSPLAPGTINPLTGKPYSGLGEPNDFVFTCSLDDTSKHVFIGMNGEILPQPAEPRLAYDIYPTADTGQRLTDLSL